MKCIYSNDEFQIFKSEFSISIVKVQESNLTKAFMLIDLEGNINPNFKKEVDEFTGVENFLQVNNIIF